MHSKCNVNKAQRKIEQYACFWRNKTHVSTFNVVCNYWNYRGEYGDGPDRYMKGSYMIYYKFAAPDRKL